MFLQRRVSAPTTALRREWFEKAATTGTADPPWQTLPDCKGIDLRMASVRVRAEMSTGRRCAEFDCMSGRKAYTRETSILELRQESRGRSESTEAADDNCRALAGRG